MSLPTEVVQSINVSRNELKEFWDCDSKQSNQINFRMKLHHETNLISVNLRTRPPCRDTRAYDSGVLHFPVTPSVHIRSTQTLIKSRKPSKSKAKARSRKD